MSECILWPWKISANGYGSIKHAGHSNAHRFIYEIFKGPIPPGMHVLHSCDNRKCVNPEHLSVGTPQQNVDDRNARSRNASKRKLTPAQVREIRDGLRCRDAMRAFGIAASTYYLARSGQRYGSVAEET